MRESAFEQKKKEERRRIRYQVTRKILAIEVEDLFTTKVEGWMNTHKYVYRLNELRDIISRRRSFSRMIYISG